jgi:hypothetical protein
LTVRREALKQWQRFGEMMDPRVAAVLAVTPRRMTR